MALVHDSNETIESYLERIFLSLRNIAHLSSKYSKYLQKNFDLTNSQLLILRALYKEDCLSAGEIGKRIFIKPGTITGVLDRLEKKQLVTRVRNTTDRRVVNISITDTGRQLVSTAPVPVQSRLAINLKGLAPDDIKALTESVERLTRLMISDGKDMDWAKGEGNGDFI